MYTSVCFTLQYLFAQTEVDHQNLLSCDIDAERVQSLQIQTTKNITHIHPLHLQFQVHIKQCNITW